MKDNIAVKLYTIGDIAGITGLTRTMLMYYEEKGIVVPVMRNQDNNYRYYNEKQLEELLLLKELKRVGFSIEQLTAIMKNRDLEYLKTELEKKMQLHNEMLINTVKEMNHYNELYYRVLDALSLLAWPNQQPPQEAIGGANMHFHYHKELPIVSISYHGIFNYRKIFMEKLAQLYKIIEQYNLATDGPINVIFHDCISTSYSDTEGDIEVFIPMVKADFNCPNVRMLPAAQYIYSTLKGNYTSLQEEYERLLAYADNLKIICEKTSMEEYLVGPTMTAKSDNYVTRIFLPILHNKLK